MMADIDITINKNGVTIEGFADLTAELQQQAQNFAQNAFIEFQPLLESLGEIRLRLAPNAEQPTTASATPGQTDLPSITLQIDPSGLSSVFPNLMQQMMTVNSLVSSTTQSSRNNIIYDSLTNALRILINQFSYEQVVEELNLVFQNGGINRISPEYIEIVKKSIAQIIKDLNQYGPENIPEPEYRKITEEDLLKVPETGVVSVIPRGYKEIYYIYENDPYPGYEQWYSKTDNKTVYILREIGSYYFESLQEDIQGTSEIQLAEALALYIESDELQLTVNIFNELLAEQEVRIKTDSMNKAMGSGSGSGGTASLQQFLGYVASAVDLQASVQLPESVLNTSAIRETIDAFSESIAMVRNIREVMNEAMQIPSALADIANINLNQVLGSLGVDANISIDLDGINLGTQLNSSVLNNLREVTQGLETQINAFQNTIDLASQVLNDGVTIRISS